jgi:ABC-2 type transport system permease protein
VKATLGYYSGLYWTYLRIFIKRLAQYRADFGIMLVTTALRSGMTLLFIGIIFTRIRQLQGWSFGEVLLIFGLLSTARALVTLLLDMPYAIPGYVRSGRLDILLIRPTPPLFQLLGERGFQTSMIGSVPVAIAVTLYALSRPDVHPQLWWAFYLPLVVLTSTLIFASIVLLLACLAFRFTSVDNALYPVTWMADFGQYPASIYAPPLRFVLTWIVPYAMAGFYPAAFLLRGGHYRVYGLLAPLMGLVFTALALTVWRVASRGYQSTGTAG